MKIKTTWTFELYEDYREQLLKTSFLLLKIGTVNFSCFLNILNLSKSRNSRFKGADKGVEINMIHSFKT